MPKNAKANSPSRRVSSTSPPAEELFIGIVRAVGTDATKAKGEIKHHLHEAGYHIEEIDIARFLPGESPSTTPDRYYQNQILRMEEGDRFRRERHDYLALLAIKKIVRLRAKCHSSSRVPTTRFAYILDPLVHPDEVATLRTVYGRHFFLVSLYEDEGARKDRLLSLIEHSAERESRSAEELATRIMERDRGKSAARYRIAIGRTFHLGDVFIDVNDPIRNQQPVTAGAEEPETRTTGLTTTTLKRLFEQIFSSSRYGPSKHEIAMSYAYSAALRSSSLARRVGAAIVTPDGTLLATGYNEVPAPGGGQYPVQSDGHEIDARDDLFTPRIGNYNLDPRFGYDANDLVKFEIFDDLIAKLERVGLLRHGATGYDLLFRSSLNKEFRRRYGKKFAKDIKRARKIILRSEVFDVIEFSRSVHAEMSALMAALRHGVDIRGCYLYSTTFPCHECARHIIAAGIDRVVYVEPYPKSRVSSLHRDAIILGQRTPAQDALERRPVEFIPFIGISLSRQPELFSTVPRKAQFGSEYPPGKALAPKIGSAITLKAELRWLKGGKSTDRLAQSQRRVAEEIILKELHGLQRNRGKR